MRPSRSATRLAVPAFPDSYGPRYIRERSRERAGPHREDAAAADRGPARGARREAAGIGARMKVEMERLLDRVGRVRPVILYPFAVILGFLLAYAWWLVIVGVILPVFVQLVGADENFASRDIRQRSGRPA